MTSPDERANDQARSAAIALVEDAFKAGRIVQADRTMRVDQLRWARTMQDVDLVVRDLRQEQQRQPPAVAAPAPAPAPSPGPPAPPTDPWPLVNYGPAGHHAGDVATVAAAATGKGAGRAIGAIISLVVMAAVVVPAVVAVIAFTSSRDTLPSFGDLAPTDETTYVPGQAPGENGVNVHTVEGYQAMVAALVEETGDPYAYVAVVYPRYAVLQVPTGKNDRYQNHYWDGQELTLQDLKAVSTDVQVDLSLIEPQLMIDTLDEMRARVEDPVSWYAVISEQAGGETRLTVHASNDFGENSYVVKQLDGTVVYDSEAQ